MPQIPIFENPDNKIDIPTSGMSDLANAARREGQLGAETAAMDRQAGQDIARGTGELGKGVTDVGTVLENHEGLADSTSVANNVAQTGLRLTQQLHKLDPNDPQAAQNFLTDNVEPGYQAVIDAAQTPQGRKLAQAQYDTAVEHWGAQAASTQASAAGQVAKGNLDQADSAFTATVQADPNQLPHVLAQIQDAHTHYAQTAGNLTAEQQAAITGPTMIARQQEVIKTAILSKLETNPNADISGDLKAYGPRIGGEAVNELQQKQQALQKIAQTQARSDQAASTLMNKEVVTQAAAQLITSTLQPDGTAVIPPDYGKNLIKLAGLGATETQIKTLHDYQQSVTETSLSGKQDTTDPTIARNFNSRLFDANNPLTEEEVLQAKIGHQLSTNDFQLYSRSAAAAAKQTADAVIQMAKSATDTAKQFLNPTNNMGGAATPDGAYKMSVFTQQFQTQFLNAQRQGGQVLRDFFEPNSQTYWGKSIPLAQINQLTAPAGWGGGQNPATQYGLSSAPASTAAPKAPISSFFSHMMGH